MTKITTLADEIRNRIAQPQAEKAEQAKAAKAMKTHAEEAQILQLIRAYDNSNHKSLVHVRFDEKTARTLNHFKMATGIDVTRLVAFAVKQLFEGNPELKAIIKQFIQNMTL
ncbi:hypothetical protein G7092_01890 [Mucilaginibacter sp. HC2]|uniref:hypothetical protein n=1 Tax=Mucilaginibacter inviolabilis TaxID=2714892 RepID=UPI00140CABE6|nr:hypothetical protein [Mucilaginibacter inviolabilis]NHA02525.1 hypothetical protein [Mucilaginibacter inviolabilis]